MNTHDFRKTFGDEYPAAVVQNGVRMALIRETPFSRWYQSDDPKMGRTSVSRYMDGSASRTAAELQRDWPTWTDEQRWYFCDACSWLYKQSDFADMLRFLMQHASLYQLNNCITSVATYLPRDEVFPFLRGALQATDIGRGGNIIQGIAITKHPDAEATLRQHLRAVWDNPKLWEDDDFLNWVAADAKACIQNLIELGASPADFEDQVRRLSEHVCGRNRDSCRHWLSKHYSWLK